MAARERARLELDAVAAEGVDHLERIFPGKRVVVIGVDDEDVFAGAVGLGAFEALVIADGTDGGPERAEAILRETGLLDRLADMARALAGPDYVPKRSRRMIEGVHAQTRIVGAGEKGVTGAEAGAQDAEVFVALLFEPVKATADIDDGLAAGGNGAADVGAHGVVGALKLGGTANIVVGLGEPQRRDTHAVEESAKSVVTEAVGVPLRQHHDGLPGPRGIFVRRSGIPAGVDEVVFRVGRAFRRGEAQKLRRLELAGGGPGAEGCIARQGFGAHVGGEQLGKALLEAEVGGAAVAEKEIAVTDEKLIDARHGGFSCGGVAQGLWSGERARESVGLEKWSDPLEAPFQGARHPIFIARGEPRFPAKHQARVPV